MNPVLLVWPAGLLGIALPSFLPALPDWRWCLALPLLLWPAWRRLPGRARPLALAAAMLLLGIGYGSARADWRAHGLLPAEWEGKPIELTGVVRGLSDVSEHGSRFGLEVETVESARVELPGRLQLNDGGGQNWPPGSHWRLTVALKRPHGTLNAAGFDAEAWFWADGVLASGSVRKGRAELGAAHDLGAWIDRLRAAALARWLGALGATPEAALCAALTVGAQQALPPDVWSQLSRTGLTHLISVSGVHITLLAALIAKGALALARRRPSPRWPPRLIGAGVGLLAAFVYALLAGYTVPTQRSLYMLAAVVGALAWRRSFSVLQIWLAALTLVLLIDPFAVLAPGFWLSFGLVGLLLMSGAGRRGQPGRIAAGVGGQWAATVGSLAPLAGFFGSLPLISPLANAVAIPLVSALLTPLALLALLLPFEFGLRWAGWLAHQCLSGLALLAEAPAHALPALPWPLLLVGGLGTLWLLAPRGVPGRYGGALCLLPLLLYAPPRPAAGAFRASMIDVGQGLAVLVETAGHNLLFDTGAGNAGRTLLPTLQAHGLKQLDALVLSHHDSDHDGAAAGLLAGWPVRALWLGQPESVEPQRRAAAMPCRAGAGWQWDGVAFAWLAPFGDEEEGDDNAHSCVLRITAAGGSSMLLAGDLPAAGEARLIERYGTAGLASELLVAPHHGSNTSSSAPFIAAVAPRAVWLSVGYRNRYHHPHPKVLARYRDAGVAIWRSDRDGAVGACSGALAAGVAQAERQARFWRWSRQGFAPAPPGGASRLSACR